MIAAAASSSPGSPRSTASWPPRRRPAWRADPGPASVFIGQIHCRARSSTSIRQVCRLEGTRRWLPGADRRRVERDFRRSLTHSAGAAGTAVNCDGRSSATPFASTRRPVRRGVPGRLRGARPAVRCPRAEAVRRRRQQLLGPGRRPGDHPRTRAGGQHTVEEWVSIDDMGASPCCTPPTGRLLLLSRTPTRGNRRPRPPRPDRRRPDDRGALPPPDLRPRPDGRVVEAPARHGPRRRRPLLGRPRQALPRRPVRHLRRLGRPQQPPRDRRRSAAARHALLLAADARHQPAGRAAGQPAGRAGPRRPSAVKFQCGGSEVDRGRDQARPPVPPAHRLARASTRSSAATCRGTARRSARCRPRA